MTPTSVLVDGFVTEMVFENCSAAYTRSRPLIATSGADRAPGAWPADVDSTAMKSATAETAPIERVRFIAARPAGGNDRAAASGLARHPMGPPAGQSRAASPRFPETD